MDIRKPFVHYSRSLVERSRELRRQETSAEKQFWEIVRGKKLLGYKFTRQKPILGYIVDFYCAELLLIVEIDGSSHDQKQEYDHERTDELAAHGFSIKRYANEDVEMNLSFVVQDLTHHIQTLSISR